MLIVCPSVTNVAEDIATFTTHLTAQTASWSDVAGNYDLDFGQIHHNQTSQRMNKRWDYDITPHIVNVTSGQPDQVFNIYSGGEFNLDCINCYTAGSFIVTGHISTKDFSLKELTLDAAPQDFHAMLELQAKVTASNSPSTLQKDVKLVHIDIPGASIEVPGLFHIGPQLELDAGFSATIQGDASMNIGLSASLPDSARLTANVVDPTLSTATSFDGSVKPSFLVNDASASLSLQSYAKLILIFGVDLKGIGTADVSIGVRLPAVNADFTTRYGRLPPFTISSDMGAVSYQNWKRCFI